MATCQHINLQNKEKICTLANHESRTKVVSDISELLENVESLKHYNLSEISREISIIKDDFLARTQAMSELIAGARSTIESLNYPLEGGIIKFNKTTSSFLNKFFSVNPLRDRIAVEYSLRNGIVLKSEILKKERDLQELLDKSNKELASLRKEYTNTINSDLNEIILKKNTKIKKLRLKIENNEELINTKDLKIEELHLKINSSEEMINTKDQDIRTKNIKIENLELEITCNEEMINTKDKNILTIGIKLQDLQLEITKNENLIREYLDVLNRNILNPFINLPEIRGNFLPSPESAKWLDANVPDQPHLETSSYHIFISKQNSINVYDKITEEQIIFYEHSEKDNEILKFFASPDERFLIVGDSTNVFLLEIQDKEMILKKCSHSQTISNAKFNENVSYCVTYSDSVALIWDLKRSQCIIEVKVNLRD